MKNFYVGICGHRLCVRSKYKVEDNATLVNYWVHEDDLKAITPINPYSLFRSLLSTYKKDHDAQSTTVCHAEQHMREAATGEASSQRQLKALDAFESIRALLNACPDTNLGARDSRHTPGARHYMAHPKVVSICSLVYIITEFLLLYEEQDKHPWLPQYIYMYDDQFKIYSGDEQPDMLPHVRIGMVEWLTAWLNYFKQPFIPYYYKKTEYSCTFEEVFIEKYFMSIEEDNKDRMLPIAKTTETEPIDAEIVEETVQEEIADAKPIELSDDDIMPKANGTTIVVPEPDTTDKMFAGPDPEHPKMSRLKFPIKATAAYLSWRLDLRAEKPELEDYCRVVSRIMHRKYPELQLECSVISTNSIHISVRDYDLEDSYPLVDPSIDLDAELEKPINKLTDNRLFRRIRELERIIDECHELFYELVRTEYLMSST